MKDKLAQTHPDPHVGILPLAAGLLLFAPISLIGNEIGTLLRYPDIGAAVLYPPYAALAAALVVSRPRDWVWYVAVASVTHLVTHWPQFPLSWVLLADVANLARALVAAALLRRLCGGPPHLDSLRTLAVFIVCAVVVAPAVGATIGAFNTMLHVPVSSYVRTWSAWFVSNALTGLAMMPACILAFELVANWRQLRIRRERVVEALLLAVVLYATCSIAFLDRADDWHLALPLYAPLPVLIWAALHFGSGGASLTMSVITYAAIWSVDRGKGPFLVATPGDNVFALQTFVLLTSAPVLCLAAIATSRRNAVQLYRSLLASLQDHVAILDANGNVIEVNRSWRQFAEASDVPLYHRVRRGDHYVAACRSAAEQGDATAAQLLSGVLRVLGRADRFEIEYEHDHDGLREAYAVRVEMLDRLDGGAVVTRSNVTARRQAQEEIDEQRHELSHLARVAVLGQLSGALAHELNQPLTAILANAGAARLLLERRHPDLKQIADIMEDIADDDERAAAVIRRFRALLKRGEMQLQLVDARELIDDVLQLARTELITRYVKTTAVVDPSTPPFLGDKVQLQQVLLNFVLNACEAMSRTAAADRRILVTAGTDAAERVHFAIRDCGGGIPAELIDRLFEPFVTTKPDGLGLGLSISRTIVAAHGGRIWAENNPDGGATIHVVIPITESQNSADSARVAVLAGAHER